MDVTNAKKVLTYADETNANIQVTLENDEFVAIFRDEVHAKVCYKELDGSPVLREKGSLWEIW